MSPSAAAPGHPQDRSPSRRAELLQAYDQQLRGFGRAVQRAGVAVERDGPVLRVAGRPPRGMVMGSGLSGLSPEATDLLIERQRRFFAARGEPVEWKTWAHDEPTGFGERLQLAGFRPQEEETIMVGLAADVPSAPPLPEGVAVRRITSASDFERLALMIGRAWGEDQSWLAESYRSDFEARPGAVLVLVAEAGDEVVSGARADFEEGTEFCTLWGGATLPQWRRRGIYRALVSIRARLAEERGYRYLEVDASPQSRPVLERLGLVPVTTSVPYFFDPSPGPTFALPA